MKVRSATQPQAIEMLADKVLVASNITPYEEEYDGRVSTGYEYDCECYTKDEYILLMAQQLQAAKILLGVD